MANLTDVIMITSLLEDKGPEDGPETFPAMDALNAWLIEHFNNYLWCATHPVPGNYGPCFVWLGTFRMFNKDTFAEAVRAQRWEWSDHVQVFIRYDGDNYPFRELKIWP